MRWPLSKNVSHTWVRVTLSIFIDWQFPLTFRNFGLGQWISDWFLGLVKISVLNFMHTALQIRLAFKCCIPL